MATYAELHNLADSNILIDRISVAITIAAISITSELETTPNHANRVIWAKSAFENPHNLAKSFLVAMLAIYNDQSVAVIQNATDAQIQNAVDSVVNVFAGG